MVMNGLKIAAAASALLLVAACSSDDAVFGGPGPGGGGGGGGSTITSLGVTGEGGVTEALGLAGLVDPLLGTEGVLGGGGEGAVGGVLPAELTEGLAPVGEALAPVIAGLEAIPLDMVTDQLPALGISGEGGLGESLLGQDVTGMLLGETGTVPGLLAGGSDGLLGGLLSGGLPGGGGGDSPLAPVTDLVEGLLGGGLPGLPGGGDNPLAPVTDLLGGGLPGLPGGGGDNPLAPVTDLLGGLGGGGGDPLAPVTGLLGGLAGGLPTP
jgi:hypothetical protein